MQETRTGDDQADGSARELIRHTKRVTRRRFTPEEKVRIVIEGTKGEIPISTLCRPVCPCLVPLGEGLAPI
jgi:hypothetical protein